VDFLLNAASGVPLNQQIKSQLRYLIMSGELSPGAKIPSIRELAAFLKTNRNTVSKAYKELEREGYLEIRRATGTYVAQNFDIPLQKKTKEFVSVLKEAMQRSLELGFSPDDVVDMVQMLMLKEKNAYLSVKALFVECNPFALEQYVSDLTHSLGINIEGALIDDLAKIEIDKYFLDSFDLIITTAGHYPEVKEILGNRRNIYGINLGPYLKLVEQLLEFPSDKKIGVICMSFHSGEGLKLSLMNLGIKADLITVGSSSDEDIKRVIANSDILVVSKFVLMSKKDFFDEIGKQVIEYENVLSESSVEILREVIKKITSCKSRV